MQDGAAPAIEVKTARQAMKINYIVLLKRTDCVFDDEGNLIRIKRKYGKYDRPIVKIPQQPETRICVNLEAQPIECEKHRCCQECPNYQKPLPQ